MSALDTHESIKKEVKPANIFFNKRKKDHLQIARLSDNMSSSDSSPCVVVRKMCEQSIVKRTLRTLFDGG